MAVLSTLQNALLSTLSLVDPRAATLARITKLFAIIIVLINLKVLPFYWHGRFWYALYYHLLYKRQRLPKPKNLFAPVKIATRSPLYECDFNYHKSNSTYFADLDIGRTHLVAALIKESLRLRKQRKEKPLYVALGGVSCVFRREIKPYQEFELWSRVLSWDDKWFWVVSHFVSVGGGNGEKAKGKKKIYASALSKYVFKVERKTIPPAVVLEESGVLPPRIKSKDDDKNGKNLVNSTAGLMESADIIMRTEIIHPHLQHLMDNESINGSETPSVNGESTNLSFVDQKLQGVSSNGKTLSEDDDDSEELEMTEKITNWDWETVEKLRRQGLKVANHFIGLDSLEGEFEKGNDRSGWVVNTV